MNMQIMWISSSRIISTATHSFIILRQPASPLWPAAACMHIPFVLIYFLCAPGTEWCSGAHLYNSPARHRTDQFSFDSDSEDIMIGSSLTKLVSSLKKAHLIYTNNY